VLHSSLSGLHPASHVQTRHPWTDTLTLPSNGTFSLAQHRQQCPRVHMLWITKRQPLKFTAPTCLYGSQSFFIRGSLTFPVPVHLHAIGIPSAAFPRAACCDSICLANSAPRLHRDVIRLGRTGQEVAFLRGSGFSHNPTGVTACTYPCQHLNHQQSNIYRASMD
jgi:hypothetical protein